MVDDQPTEGEFVQVEFEGEFGNQSPIHGKVIDVTTDTEDIPEIELLFVVDDDDRNIVVGVDEKSEVFVNVQNRNLQLGKNGSWRRLQ